MAIQPRNNEAFYREVDEELRREQANRLWRRYGIAAIVAVALILAAIGAYIWYGHYQEERASKTGGELIAVLDQLGRNESKGIEPKIEALAKADQPGYRAAALFTKGSLAAQRGDDAAAAAAFKAIADNDDLAKPYRDLALIRQTVAEFDRLPPDTVVARLRPLAVAGNPWFGSAGELVAAAHIKANRPQQAAPIFAAMAKDEKIPESLRLRAVQMAGALGVDAVRDPAASGETVKGKN